MKKYLLLAALLITVSAHAQRFRLNKVKAEQKKNVPVNYVEIIDGDLWVIKGDKKTPALETMVMGNGTIVNPRGMLIFQNKKRGMLKGNQRMDLNGVIYNSSTNTRIDNENKQDDEDIRLSVSDDEPAEQIYDH